MKPAKTPQGTPAPSSTVQIDPGTARRIAKASARFGQPVPPHVQAALPGTAELSPVKTPAAGASA